ncbi:MAG: hypothetical protein ABSB22_24210 [Thermodesulfobacteriota bacterium]
MYGVQNCWAVHRSLKRLLAAETSPIVKFDRLGLETLYAERVSDTHMCFDNFVRSEKDKVMQGQFRGRPYFIRFLQEPAETGEGYGHIRCTPLGRAGIRATIKDAAESIFTPCRYPLEAVRFLEGIPVEPVTEIVSYRGRFCEQARAWDVVQAYGIIERVQTRDGRVWHRLLLGNHPDDILLVRR